LQERIIAIVGARDSTEYGDSAAEMFATELARRGIVLISGLARGIDSIAHRRALELGTGTIAVLGCGIDVYYPHQNAHLQDRIAEEGLLISEFEPGMPAMRHHFPQRNRLIALLSNGVLVVEAGPKSGTRITAGWALRYGMDVFAIPGPIGRHESQGTNETIQDGGHLVMSVRDILEILHWTDAKLREVPYQKATTEPSLPANKLLSSIDVTSVHVDELARRCGLSIPETLGLLVQLELDGLVVQQPGKRFSRKLSA
jgi:DNA processing protein